MPKCPVATSASKVSARGAARAIARTEGGGAIESSVPTKDSTGQLMSASVDITSPTTKPALQHPVVGEELLDQFGDGRARVGDVAGVVEELTLALARQQGLAVVQLQQELDAAAGGLHRVEHPEAEPGGPRREAHVDEDVVGEQAGDLGDHVLGDHAEDPGGPGVHGGAEGDQAGDALAAPVGRDLVGEHAALGVAGQVHVATGGGADDVDGVVDRDDVVDNGALEPALLALGGAEVDDPGVQARVAEEPDRAGRGRDVVDLGGHHQRRDQQHRGPGRRAVPVGAGVGEVAPQPEHRPPGHDHELARQLTGEQSAVADHLRRVRHRGAELAQRAGQAGEVHGANLRSRCGTTSGPARLRGAASPRSAADRCRRS